MIIVDQDDITDRLREQGWRLAGVSVLVNLFQDPDQPHPRDVDAKFHADVDEPDPRHPNHGFCRFCGAWMRRLTVEASNAYNQKVADNDPDDKMLEEISDPGQWLPVGDEASILCPKHDDGRDLHELDHPLVVRAWDADEWAFGGIEVQVSGHDGVELGAALEDQVPFGRYPSRIDPATGVVEYRNLNPLAFDDERVQRLVRQALAKAKEFLVLHGTFVIVAPTVRKGQS